MLPAAPVRYGGIVASTLALRSRQAQAASVSCGTLPAPPHGGGHQSAGHPDQAEGRILGGGADGVSGPSRTTPLGSPGTAAGGPTVAGGTSSGGFGFGTTSSGGRIIRENRD